MNQNQPDYEPIESLEFLSPQDARLARQGVSIEALDKEERKFERNVLAWVCHYAMAAHTVTENHARSMWDHIAELEPKLRACDWREKQAAESARETLKARFPQLVEGAISTRSDEYRAMSPADKLIAWGKGLAYDEEPTDDDVLPDDFFED